MAKFIVHQMRCKTSSNTCTASHTVAKSDEKGTVWMWISSEKMDTVLGPMKAQHWRDSKLLEWRPDSLTQSTEEAFKEYKVPERWEKMSEQDISKLLVEVTGEATEEDLANVASASWQRDGDVEKSDDVGTPVKQEEETALQKLEKKITQLKHNPRTTFDRFTTMTVEAKKIESNGEASGAHKGYACALMDDLKKHIPKLGRATKLLEKMLTSPPDEDQLPKLVGTLDELTTSHLSILTWAQRFSLADDVKPPKGSKRKRKE